MVASSAAGLAVNPALLHLSFLSARQPSSSQQSSSSCCAGSVGTAPKSWIPEKVHQGGKRQLLSFSASTSLRGVTLRGSFRGCATSTRPGTGVARASTVKKISAEEWQELLSSKRAQPVVVDIYAAWCGPCVLLAPVLDKLAVEYGDAVRFYKLDADKETELADELEIRGLPTLIFIAPDSAQPVVRTEGLLSAKAIREILEKQLHVPAPVAQV